MLPQLIWRVGLVFLIGVVLAAICGFFWLHTEVKKPLNIGEDGYVLVISSGESLSLVARNLADKKILQHPYALLIQARLTGNQSIQQGEYRLEAGDTTLTLLEKLTTGAVVRYTVTFPEGRTFRQWLTILAAQEPMQTLSDSDIATFTDRFHQQWSTPPEGWFFPDTYTYVRGDGPVDILERARRRMEEELEREWQSRDAGLPYDSPYQALIMASIIEKETGVAAERGEIAGVFVRRLQRGMRLQTDPTVIYGLGDSYQGNLTRTHLRQDTPYNTYRINGLPPTPIANPGLASIQAALHPTPGNSLYFVARGDGSHQFSATLEQHRQAVREFQLRRRSDYRSSPAPQSQQTNPEQSR